MKRVLAIAWVVFASGCADVQLERWDRSTANCPTASEAWATVAPAEAGLDGERLEALAQRIEAGELGNLHSLLVVRDGRLAFERYFSGSDAQWGRPLGSVAFDAETLHDLRSVTKSVVSSLVGIAHGSGEIADLDAPLITLLPDHARPELAGLRLRDALTMTAGLSWDEMSYPYWDPRNDETAMWRRDDPIAYVLTRDVVAEPGERFAYNGGLPTVLAATVERASGSSLEAFARDRLWCPLGVAATEWVRHGSGTYVAASGLRLRPRDMARFGWMMANGGRFAGRSVVPEEFATAALSRQVDTDGSITDGYGYQWWIGEGPIGREVPLAIGNGGQRIAIFGDERVVVVVTAGAYDSRDQGAGPNEAILGVYAALIGERDAGPP